tara:strand:- start:3 stop:857 length:855 start_codon:yes stop_codon:yes gene_type:complete
MINKGLNTKQVGNLFNVDESTVRRWALSGKIKCSSSAGGHRKFSYKDLIKFSINNNIKLNKDKDSTMLSQPSICNKMVKAALDHNYKLIEMLLIELYLSGFSLGSIMDDYIEKTLVKIQKKLDDKIITVAEEHIARKIVSQALGNFKQAVSNDESFNGKNILCLNLENDIPDLPIDMIEILLKDINYNVHNCGSHTSVKDIKNLLSNKNYEAIFIYLCDRQCCTSTLIDHIEKTNSDLKEISKLGEKYNIRLFLGGPYFKNIDKDTLKKYKTFKKYSEVLKLIK